MSPLWLAVAGVGGLFLSLSGIRGALQEDHPLVRPNHVGRPVPVVLGALLVRAASSGLILGLGLALLAGEVEGWPIPLFVLGGGYLLFLVGSLDDRSTGDTRGLPGHVAALARGRVTTGIWKLLAGVGIAVVLGLELGGGIGRVVLSVVVIAVSINVTNAMDVRPGRALKWAAAWLVPVAAVAAWNGSAHGMLLGSFAYAGAGLGVLRWDLRERGMLGDAGSNPLGLVVGTSLAAVLPLWGLLLAMGILVGLQIAAETVTISRLIDSVPPLRWFDRLGRRD